MRLGTYYRSLMLDKLGITANKDFVLDVGCFDGYWLSQQQHAKIKIAVDINPVNKYENVMYIKGDALNLPFKNDVFDQVFAFDVIEHVENDKRFLNELCNVCKVDSEIIISTPHKKIKIYPPFLTNWVSKKWGHLRVNGYLDKEIKNLTKKNVVHEFFHIKEAFYRFFYFPARLLWGFNENLTKIFVKMIVYLDTRALNGENGQLLVKMVKINSNCEK